MVTSRVALVLVVALVACAQQNGPPAQVPSVDGTVTWDPNEYEETRNLEGAELMAALTKVTFAVSEGDVVNAEVIPVELNGEPIPGCPPEGAPQAAIIGIGEGMRACIGIASSEEGRDIFERFSGHASA